MPIVVLPRDLASPTLALVLSSGCGPSGGFDAEPYCTRATPPAAPVGDGPTLDELCPMVGGLLCAQWERCGCLDASGAFERAACIANVERTCGTFVANDEVRGAIDRGALVWSGPAALAFALALERATVGCDPVELDLSGLAVGAGTDGTECTDVSGAFTECEDGRTCQVVLGAPRTCRIDSVTARTQVRGERCGVFTGCAPGLRCAGRCPASAWSFEDEGVCVDALPLGARCRFGSDCLSRFCHPDFEPEHWARLEGHCATPGLVASGGTCTSEGDCASGSFCVRTAAEGSRACRSLLSEGEACWDGGDCASGGCVPSGPAFPGRCASPRAPDDAPCQLPVECAGGRCVDHEHLVRTTCEDGADCASCPGDCVTWSRPVGRCASFRATGEACVGAAECLTGACESGVCAERPPPLRSDDGEPCTADDECPSADCVFLADGCYGLDCPPSRCRGARSSGEPCGHPLACASESCVDGVCRDSVCSARLDPTGHGAFWLRVPVFTLAATP